MSIAQEIKARVDIVDVVGEYVDLKRSGRNLSGFCPFHPNSRTPAFFVSPERQTWQCFGACAEGGDVYSFLMKKEGWSFREALEELARRTGIALPEYKPKSAAQQSAEDRLGGLMEKAADYYHHLLLTAPQGAYARDYLERRELSAETIAGFKLGYALQSWDACRNHFEEEGYSREELLNVGLLTFNEEKDSTYDRFRHRVMFPIRNVEGRIVGFGARTLEKDGIPKYLNSPQTMLFDKSHILYGIDVAKRHMREAGEVVIVEGYMDVIRAHQAGFLNVVAQMGTALTEPQLNQLKRYTKRFVIALDADAAGVQATMRSLEVARETMDREYEVSINPRGLVKQEGRIKADIRIASLPDGQDPDDIIRADPATWTAHLEKAKPVVKYVIDTLTADLNHDDPKAKSAVAQRIVPLIKDIPDAVERDHWWQMLGTTLGTTRDALQKIGGKSKKRQTRRVQSSSKERPSAKLAQMEGKRSSPLAVEKLEAHFLRELLAYPLLLATVDHQLRTMRQPAMTQDDFTATEDKLLFAHIQNSGCESAESLSETLYDEADSVVISRVEQLLKDEATSDDKHEHLPQRLTSSVLNWRLDKIKRQLQGVQRLITSENGESDQSHLDMCQMLMVMMQSIHQAQSELQRSG